MVVVVYERWLLRTGFKYDDLTRKYFGRWWLRRGDCNWRFDCTIIYYGDALSLDITLESFIIRNYLDIQYALCYVSLFTFIF